MRADVSPLQVLIVTLAGWVNRHHQQVIEYLVEENRVLKEQVKGRRLRPGSHLRPGRQVDRRIPTHRPKRGGVRTVLTPARAPNANAYAERFVRSIRAEYLDRLILFGERRLLRALDEFVAHYHGERNHQGLANELITPATLPLVGPRSAAGTG